MFVLYSEIRTNLSYGHPLIPRCPDKRGLTVHCTDGKVEVGDSTYIATHKSIVQTSWVVQLISLHMECPWPPSWEIYGW